MAGEDRTATTALDWYRELEAEPWKYGFYEALRRIEALHPDKPRLGRTVRPDDDPVRLAQEPSLAFAPSTLRKLEWTQGGSVPRLYSLFFGVFGPNGPLPHHLTEFARQRWRSESDPTFARFADLFHHRMMSLFYRAWADGTPAVSYDRPSEDRFLRYAGALCGYGLDSQRGRDRVTDSFKLHFAGRFGLHTKNADGLEGMLRGFFKVPVRILEMVGEWIHLPNDALWRLGQPGHPDPNQAIGQLGVSTTVGGRVWQCQQKFRVVIGPMPYAIYQRFVPGGEALDRLTDLIRNYVGDELLWDVNLILDKDEVPPLKLGEEGRLGWTSWVASQPLADDDDSACFTPLEQMAG